MTGDRWEGHRRRQAVAACFRDKGRVCYWCGHDGATDVDHIIPKSRGGSVYDPANHAPIHGTSGCPICGRRCNREKADKPLPAAPHLRTSRDWYAA